MLISENYKAQNKRLHSDNASYGTSGSRWAGLIKSLCNKLSTLDVLDYGCGKGTLQRSLDFVIQQYDPCIEGLDSEPAPADLVVCTDVLEHIEPECVDSVLDHIQTLTKKTAFLVIATRPAKKILPDGRNAHLIQEQPRWWLEKLHDRFDLSAFQDLGGEFFAIVNAQTRNHQVEN